MNFCGIKLSYLCPFLGSKIQYPKTKFSLNRFSGLSADKYLLTDRHNIDMTISTCILVAGSIDNNTNCWRRYCIDPQIMVRKC